MVLARGNKIPDPVLSASLQLLHKHAKHTTHGIKMCRLPVLNNFWLIAALKIIGRTSLVKDRINPSLQLVLGAEIVNASGLVQTATFVVVAF